MFHQDRTKTFEELTFAEQAKSINAQIVVLQRSIRAHVTTRMKNSARSRLLKLNAGLSATAVEQDITERPWIHCAPGSTRQETLKNNGKTDPSPSASSGQDFACGLPLRSAPNQLTKSAYGQPAAGLRRLDWLQRRSARAGRRRSHCPFKVCIAGGVAGGDSCDKIDDGWRSDGVFALAAQDHGKFGIGLAPVAQEQVRERGLQFRLGVQLRSAGSDLPWRSSAADPRLGWPHR